MALPTAVYLSGLSGDYFSDNLHFLFLLQQSAISSPVPPRVTHPPERNRIVPSPIMAENDVPKTNGLYDLLCESEVKVKSASQKEVGQVVSKSMFPQAEEVKPVTYQGRNLLDLYDNIQWDPYFVKPPQKMELEKLPPYGENKSKNRRKGSKCSSRRSAPGASNTRQTLS